MRKTLFAIFTFVLFSISVYAAERHQSYISYDDGQAIVRQPDGREVEASVNVPIFPGDELETGRRGRSEVRLADGNVLAIDRNTSLRFQSILDSYEGDSELTVTELLFGTAMVHAIRGDSSIRVDTASGTYVSRARSLYSIETASAQGDDVAVFTGSIEIRTPEGTERVRAGERVRVDRRGIYGQSSSASYGNSDFERWYIRRAERYGRSSRYLDRRIAYGDYDLDGYGSWVYVNDYDSWAWRPYVSVGWRPYYYGRWGYSRWGSLIWISSEPWGWVPYHYGRWAFSPVYGWLWVPGAAYSHAWVYWAFGPSYIGWIPAGWYDCYRPYYSWAYSPYVRGGFDVGFGFYGRVRFANIDYRAWTFVDPNTLVSNRADRAALTTDNIRERLRRDGDQATVTNNFPQLNREQLRNPGSAVGVIARRGAGGGTGKDGSGSLTDLTPFFRRDPDLPSAVRDRIARPVDRGGVKVDSAARAPSSPGSGRIVRRGGDTGAIETGTRDGGGVITRRLPDTPGTREDSGSIVRRTPVEDAPRRERVDSERRAIVPRERSMRPSPETSEDSWRGRVVRSAEEPAPPDWRERAGSGGRIARPDSGQAPDREPSVAPRPQRGGDDIPRRVIDRIGGARLEPSDRSSRSSGGGSVPRMERPPSRPSTVDRPSSPPPSRSSSSPRSSSDSGSGRTNIKPHNDE